jgi:hypothetical protein
VFHILVTPLAYRAVRNHRLDPNPLPAAYRDYGWYRKQVLRAVTSVPELRERGLDVDPDAFEDPEVFFGELSDSDDVAP